MNTKTYIAYALLPAVLAGCPKRDDQARGENTEPLTVGEASQALEEASISGDAENLIGASIEITTDFTIGGALEEAASEIHQFVESQLPCAEITLIQNKLTIEYGANPGNCTYNGQTYSGTHSVTVTTNDEWEVLVEHEWTALSNQRTSVSGFADVTWSLEDQTRRVVHELTWTRLSDGRSGTGSGDRLQGALDENILQGFTVDGFRKWEGQEGAWDLDVNDIEWRWTDPVPQHGSYVLTTPKDKQVSLSFERVDEDTINVTVSGGNRSFDFKVNKFGGTQVDDPEGNDMSEDGTS